MSDPDGGGWGPGHRTRRDLNGVPQPGRYAGMGGGKLPKGKHTSSSCLVTLFGLLTGPWLLDLLLAASRAAA